ncbi:HdeD family acid-resistance protein [Georgenia sp. Z1491]|uniref:HdeD family acid-resistance protein n=1 Tax=Georgenia sp. Z1491 TaxID=3416707 RepID=UPI003CF16CEC
MVDRRDPVRQIFRTSWLTTAGRGIAAVAVGVAVILWPGTMIDAVIQLFSIFLLVDGLLNVLGGIGLGVDARNQEPDRPTQKILTIVLGVVEIAAGIFGLVRPGNVATLMITVIGVWAIVMGLWELITALRARRYVHGVRPLVVAGTFFVVVGAFVVWRPWVSLDVVAWTVAIAALLWGVMQIVVALSVRRWIRNIDDRLEVDREPPRMLGG